MVPPRRARVRRWFTAGTAWLAAVRLTTISAVLIVALIVGYLIEGAGRTIIAAFRIPAGSEGQVGGDGATLTAALIAEMSAIRAVGESARRLRFNLVKGLDAHQIGGGSLDLDMSVRVNADYKSLIEHLGSVNLEWGAVRLPVEVVLRPLQGLVGQHVVEVVLERDGDAWRVFSAADDGRLWEAASAETAALPGEPCNTVRCVVRTLAYKMAFLAGDRYEPAASWMGHRHLHQGLRCLVDYDRRARSDRDRAIASLDEAGQHFRTATELNPSHREAHYNLLLATFERVSFMPPADRVSRYRQLLKDTKTFLQTHGDDADQRATQLLAAAYVLLAEALLVADPPEGTSDKDPLESARSAYKAVLVLLPEKADLRAYVLNNLGQTYRAEHPEQARRWFRAAVRQNPRYPRPRVNLGNVALDSGDYAAAEDDYVSVLQEWPDHPGSLFNLALLYRRLAKNTANWERLDDATRDCLHRQATAGLHAYIAALERDSVTRELSAHEAEQLDDARLLLEAVAAAASGSTPSTVTRYSRCLGGR